MTEQELREQRAQRWRLDGRAVRTLDDAREFLDAVGFCLMYPLAPQPTRTPAPLPTFVGAYVGADDKLPTSQHAFRDPRAREAQELMVRLLRTKAAYEANLFAETPFLVAAAVFPYFYALVGDRNPRHLPKTGSEYSPLTRDVFAALQKRGPLPKPRLREVLGGAPSDAALDRSLNELWGKLRITRVDYKPEEGAYWDVLFRWSPDAVREGIQISTAEALSALLSKYLHGVVAAEEIEVMEFFSRLVSRSRIKEGLNALLAARELSFVHVGNRSFIQVAPARVTPAERDAMRQAAGERVKAGRPSRPQKNLA